MNILISTKDGNNNKVISNGTIQEGITGATSLGFTEYSVSSLDNTTIVVNDNTGYGYNLILNEDSTNTRYLVFDSSTNDVLSWVNTNHPLSTITNFTKTGLSLYTV